MTVPRTQTAIRALLATHGLDPRRSRGQNFLVDGNLIDAIVREAAVTADDAVLEIGTGTGILTDALAERAGAVLTCDIDGRLQAMTRGLRDWPAHVEFLAADILDGKQQLNADVITAWQAAGRDRTLRVIANLPYAIATPVLAHLLWSGLPIRDAVVLVQREAAERFLALPGSRAYGPMSVAVGLLARGRILRRVPPTVFWPQPKVESAVLHLEFQQPEQAGVWAAAGLPGLLRGGFRHRRKTVRHAFAAERLAAAELDPALRPQDVEPAAWVRLLTVGPS